jgi:hypothetical protein
VKEKALKSLVCARFSRNLHLKMVRYGALQGVQVVRYGAVALTREGLLPNWQKLSERQLVPML